jgi:hypothetical protein
MVGCKMKHNITSVRCFLGGVDVTQISFYELYVCLNVREIFQLAAGQVIGDPDASRAGIQKLFDKMTSNETCPTSDKNPCPVPVHLLPNIELAKFNGLSSSPPAHVTSRCTFAPNDFRLSFFQSENSPFRST